MKDVIVIYHKDCFDGFTAAWVAHKYFEQLEIEPIFFGASYNEDPPSVKDRAVYIVDFSYPRDILIKMYDEAHTLMVLDHHKTAEKDLEGLSYCIFDMERSGAGLAWDYFFENAPRPWLVDVVEDRDLWRFQYADTKAIQAYISTLPMKFSWWDTLSEMDRGEVRDRGGSILQYIKNYGEKAIEHLKYREIGSYLVPTLNISYQNCSDHLDLLLTKMENRVPFVASFFIDGNDNMRFSLRSKGEFDVSEIAKLYGGGGHKNAAGFVIPFERYLVEINTVRKVKK